VTTEELIARLKDIQDILDPELAGIEAEQALLDYIANTDVYEEWAKIKRGFCD